MKKKKNKVFEFDSYVPSYNYLSYTGKWNF